MKPLHLLAVGALLALPCFAQPAQAKTVKHPSSGFSFWIPDNWNVKKSGGVYVASTPNDTAAVAFKVPKASKAEKAIDDVVASLESTYKDIKMSKGHESDANGVHAYIADGTGVDRKTKAHETFAVGFYAGDKHLLVAYAVLSDSAKKSSYKVVSKILGSVKR